MSVFCSTPTHEIRLRRQMVSLPSLVLGWGPVHCSILDELQASLNERTPARARDLSKYSFSVQVHWKTRMTSLPTIAAASLSTSIMPAGSNSLFLNRTNYGYGALCFAASRSSLDPTYESKVIQYNHITGHANGLILSDEIMIYPDLKTGEFELCTKLVGYGTVGYVQLFLKD